MGARPVGCSAQVYGTRQHAPSGTATHLIARTTSARTHAAIQMAILLVPLVALPISLPSFAAPPSDVPSPAMWLLIVLGVAVALPFFVVTMTSPTLLRWFSATDHPAARDPYFLYAAGNVGSLLALLAYPFIIEPGLATTDQTRLWAAAYLAYVAMFAGCAFLTIRRSRRTVASTDEGVIPAIEPEYTQTTVSAHERPAAIAPVTIRRRLWWILLAFVPSSLMLGVTSYLTTDIAAVPLLWVIPLAIYLLTFIIAFASRVTVSPSLAGSVLAVAVGGIAVTTLRIVSAPVVLEMALHLVALFAAGLLAHGRLAMDRPHPSRLTEYFLIISLGGVLGGVFNALIAPVVFEVVIEYVAAIVLALLLRHGLSPEDGSVGTDHGTEAPRSGVRRFAWSLDYVIPLLLFVGTLVALVVAARLGGEDGTLGRIVLVVALALTFALTIRRPIRYALAIGALLAMAVLVGKPALYSDRTFFGLNRVIDEDGRHELAHGTTIHGGEWMDAGRKGVPLTYYHPTGPVRQIFSAIEAERGWTSAAVIGLGAGSMAAYGGPGQRMTFYEIDPAVATIASDPDLFTFLRDSEAEIGIVLGDGRLAIADARPGGYDLIFMDAFSSDSPPVHLLTREAMRLYLEKLAPDGLIVFNVSNRYLDLATVAARQGTDAGLVGLVQFDRELDVAPSGDKEPSEFVVLARDVAALAPIAANGRWRPIDQPAGRVWTDDYSDVIGALRL